MTLHVTPQNTFSLSLLAALVEDVEVDGIPVSRMVPAEVRISQSDWDWFHLGDRLLKLAEAECAARPGMFRPNAVAAPPAAATLTAASRLAQEWVSHALQVFPSGTDGALGWAVHAAATHLIASLPEGQAKAAFSHCVVVAMMDTVARHRDIERPRRDG